MTATILSVFLFFTIQRAVGLPLDYYPISESLENGTSETSVSSSGSATAIVFASHFATLFPTPPIYYPGAYSTIVTNASSAQPPVLTGTQILSIENTISRPPAISAPPSGPAATSLPASTTSVLQTLPGSSGGSVVSDVPPAGVTSAPAVPTSQPAALTSSPATSVFGNAVHVSDPAVTVSETLSPSTRIFTTVSLSVFTTDGHVRTTAVPVISTSVTMVPVPTATAQNKSSSSSLSTRVRVGLAVGGLAVFLAIVLVLIVSRRRYLRNRAFIRLGEEL
ncbi:hypothetical protein DFH09DRAFT_558278 [Mycena vulgaris]|nr:hypothetical protein DFH09DRAFT_558278 [Mycena vulgaris]